MEEVGRAEGLQALDFQRRSPRPFFSPSDIFPRPINGPTLSLASDYYPHPRDLLASPGPSILHLNPSPLPDNPPQIKRRKGSVWNEKRKKRTANELATLTVLPSF